MEKISNDLISKLLEKYFDATATLEEERILQDYFRGEIDDQFLEYKSLFALFSVEREAIPHAEPCFAERKERHSFRWISVAVAASIALVMFVSLPQKGDTLRLMINGVQIENKDLAMAKTDDRLSRLQQTLSKYRSTNNKLGSMEKAGDAVSSLNDFSKLLKQNLSGDRLED